MTRFQAFPKSDENSDRLLLASLIMELAIKMENDDGKCLMNLFDSQNAGSLGFLQACKCLREFSNKVIVLLRDFQTYYMQERRDALGDE